MAKCEIPIVIDSTFIKKVVRGVTASAEFNETTSDDYKKGFFDFAEALINTLEKISKSDAECSEWISTKEELPPPYESVLVCMPGEAPLPMIHEGFISKEGVWYSNHFVREADEVTHWRPIPEPPEAFKQFYTEMLKKKTDRKEVANNG